MEDLENALKKSQTNWSEDEMQQAKKDLNKFQGETKKLIFKARETAQSLRRAANKLDKVWTDCKEAHAAGTSFSILGGLCTIGGGVATFMTAGAATPLLVLGMALGGAGSVTNVVAGRIEASINSKEIKKAEEDLKETLDYVNSVNGTIQKWQDGKEIGRLLCIFCLALHTLKKTNPVMKILQKMISHSLSVSTKSLTGLKVHVAGMAGAKLAGQAAAQATDDVVGAAVKTGAQAADDVVGAAVKTGAQAADDVVGAAVKTGAQAADDAVGAGVKAGTNASKFAGKVIIGVSTVFLVWDTIDLRFTIKELIEQRGSEVAKELRAKAYELERVCSFD